MVFEIKIKGDVFITFHNTFRDDHVLTHLFLINRMMHLASGMELHMCVVSNGVWVAIITLKYVYWDQKVLLTHVTYMIILVWFIIMSILSVMNDYLSWDSVIPLYMFYGNSIAKKWLVKRLHLLKWKHWDLKDWITLCSKQLYSKAHFVAFDDACK